MPKLKNNNKLPNSLFGLFFIGLVLIIIFFVGGGASLIKQNLATWPKTKAKVISVEQRIACETPERSAACYPVFSIKYSYYVKGIKYMNQIEQMYGTIYSPGKTFDVFYKIDDPQLVFTVGENPAKFHLYLPLISGLVIIILVTMLWKFWGHIT